MNDELETRLRAAFRDGSLPAAPAGLVSALEEASNASVAGSRRRAGSWPRILAVAAVLLVGGAVALSIGNRGPDPLPVPSPRPSPDASLAAEPSASAPQRFIYEPKWTVEVPYSVDDLAAIVGMVQQRIDAAGVVGGHVATDDQKRIVVEVPAGLDPDPFRRLVGQIGHVGFVPLGDTTVEPGMFLNPESFADLLDGIVVADAAVVNDQSGNPSLQLTLGQPGTERFADYTASHVGSAIAITLDGTVAAVPTIQSEVADGVVQITFAPPKAPDPADLARVASIIRIGPLPVALVEVGGEPAPTSSAAVALDPPVRCESPLPVDGPQLACDDAVRDALAILPPGHPPIAEVTFFHDCNDVRLETSPDCAVQAFGIVRVRFVDGSPPVRIALSIGSSPTIIPNLPTPTASGP